MLSTRLRLLLVSLVLSTGLGLGGTAHAASASCFVKEVKASEIGRGARARPRLSIKLACGQSTRTLHSDASHVRDMLAIALTAKALQRKVRATFKGQSLKTLSLL